MIVEHDVVRAGDPHHKGTARHTQQRQQVIHIVLVGFSVVGITNVTAHGHAEQLAAEVILQAGTGDFLTVKQVLRADKTHHGIHQQRLEFACDGIGACLAGLLIQPVMRVRRERAALPGLKVHDVIAHAAALET